MNAAGKLAGLVAVAALLAGCQMAGPPRASSGFGNQPYMNQQPTSGVEGNWIDQAGTGISVFRAGTFETIAADSGQRLSEGSYRMSGSNLVEISGTSIIRQTAVSFNCSVASTSQLNCTAASGQQFVLARYQGPVPQPPAPPVAGAPQTPPRV